MNHVLSFIPSELTIHVVSLDLTNHVQKKKCNEERPQCNRCAERGIECSYEPVRPRQRRARESTVTSTTSGTPSSKLSTGARLSYISSRPKYEAGSSDDSDGNNNQDWSRTPAASSNHSGLPHGRLLVDSEMPWSNNDIGEISPLDISSPFSFDTASIMGTFSVAGDSMADMNALSPISTLSYNFPPNYDEGQGDEASDRVRRSSMASYHAGDGVGALVRYAADSPRRRAMSTSHTSRSLVPDLAMIAPSPTVSPLLEFQAPMFSEFSDRPNRRALVDHFCNVLSHLIVFREESGNPFQQLVLPLTARSGIVTEAMYALASAHLEYRGVETGERSMYFHNRAIQGLAQLIRKQGQGVDRNELLAAIMLLVYYEVLVQKGRSNIVEGHLKGALAIMSSSSEEPLDPTATFLERAFRFYDVIAALSNGTAPLSAAPAAGCLTPLSPLGAPIRSPLSSVDTLLGMATTLWPILHRLSTLPSLRAELDAAVGADGADGKAASSSAKIAVLRTEFEMSASSIEDALQAWQPYFPASGFSPTPVTDDENLIPSQEDIDLTTAMKRVVELDDNENIPLPTPDDQKTRPAPDPTQNRLQSILHNALAYKHSALIYLYRTVHELDRSHTAVQRHTRASLRHCAGTVSAKGPMGALLWPLFVAACEATAEEDRALARQTFLGVERRQGMMNIERAWEIVQEVWRRADEVDGGTGTGGCTPVDFGDLAGQGGHGFSPLGEFPMVSFEELFGTGMVVPEPMEVKRTARKKRGRGADLWRRVSEDMGVNIVFG
ncbi:fungal-specific transcription factor domain-containing protein [Coniochaeta sp. 2T2.1]|nr:fungal-specific transcription factor domain-containing protein [Coniochaeta sp. 2T2.1]